MIVLELREGRSRRRAIGVRQFADPRTHALDQDVEIADRAQQSAQPTELLTQTFGRSEIRFEGLEIRTETAGRDAGVVDGIGIGARPDREILADQSDHAPRERIPHQHLHARPRQELRDDDLGLGSASEDRLQLRGGRGLRTRADQPAGQVREERVVAWTLRLDLDLSEGRAGHPVDGRGHPVVAHLDRPDVQHVPVRCDRGGRPGLVQLLTIEDRASRGNPGRRPYLEGPSVLRSVGGVPVPEREAPAEQAVVGGVPVAGMQFHGGPLDGTTEGWQVEVIRDLELHLTLPAMLGHSRQPGIPGTAAP